MAELVTGVKTKLEELAEQLAEKTKTKLRDVTNELWLEEWLSTYVYQKHRAGIIEDGLIEYSIDCYLPSEDVGNEQAERLMKEKLKAKEFIESIAVANRYRIVQIVKRPDTDFVVYVNNQEKGTLPHMGRVREFSLIGKLLGIKKSDRKRSEPYEEPL